MRHSEGKNTVTKVIRRFVEVQDTTAGGQIEGK